MKYYEVVHSYNVSGARNGEGEKKTVAICASRELADRIVEEYSHPSKWYEGGGDSAVMIRYCGKLFIVEKEMSDSIAEAESKINPWWLDFGKFDGKKLKSGAAGRWQFSWKTSGKPEDRFVSSDMSVNDLDLSQRSYNCLMRAGIKTCEDLCKYSEEELMKIRNLGKKSAGEIIAKMRDKGLKLKEGY